MPELLHGDLLQSLQQGGCLRPAMGLDITRNHINAPFPGLMSILQHGVGLAHTGGISEKDLQFAAALLRRVITVHPQ